MSYEDFLKSYLINHEEFVFHCGDKEINVCYGENGSFSYNIIKDKIKILEKDYENPYELIKHIEIEGIHFPELWTILE